jgi:hypothetical protein
MATLLPHPNVTPIPNTEPPAIPSLWNTRYTEIDENFAALDKGISDLRDDLDDGSITAKEANHALEADDALRAKQDKDGNQIDTTYVKREDLTDGSIKAKEADHADEADDALRAKQDKDGNQIDTTYLKCADAHAVATSGNFNDLNNKPTGVDCTDAVAEACNEWTH